MIITILFCLDIERDIFVGTVNIRHYLNESLLLNGGHIGDGVRKSERRRGIGKSLISQTIKIAKDLSCKRVELNCWEFNEDAIQFYQKQNMKTQRRIMEIEIGGK